MGVVGTLPGFLIEGKGPGPLVLSAGFHPKPYETLEPSSIEAQITLNPKPYETLKPYYKAYSPKLSTTPIVCCRFRLRSLEAAEPATGSAAEPSILLAE